jgi:hypothetical protein
VEECAEGVGGPGGPSSSSSNLCSSHILLAPRSFTSVLYSTLVNVEGAPLSSRETEQTGHFVYISFLSVHCDGAILRLDLILRDHYVGRHRQVLRDILVLAGVVAVALRVFSLVRLILLRLLLHGPVRQLALY